MARSPHRILPILEVRRLSDGSRIEIFTKPDRYGRISFMWVKPDISAHNGVRAQAYSVIPDEWLAHYRIQIRS